MACTGAGVGHSVMHMCVGCFEIYFTCPLQPGQGPHHCLCMYSLSLGIQAIHIQCHVLRASRGDRPTAACPPARTYGTREPRPMFKALFGAVRESSATCSNFTGTSCWRGMRGCQGSPCRAPWPPQGGLKSHAWGAPLDHCGGSIRQYIQYSVVYAAETAPRDPAVSETSLDRPCSLSCRSVQAHSQLHDAVDLRAVFLSQHIAPPPLTPHRPCVPTSLTIQSRNRGPASLLDGP